ncbi:hypothetical protein BB560_007263, partial [Smittium megazygosporum]
PSQPSAKRITRNVIIKCSIILVLIVIKIVETVFSVDLITPKKVNAVTVSGIITAIAFSVAFVLQYLEQTKSKTQSHFLVLFWFISYLFMGIWYWTQIVITDSSFSKNQSRYFYLTVAEGVVLILIWALELVTNREPYKLLVNNTSGQKECPEKYANVYSRLTFEWMSSLLKIGKKRILKLSDVWMLPDYLKVESTVQHFEKSWSREVASYPKSPSVWRTVARAYGRTLSLSMFYKLIYDILSFSQTLIFSRLLRFVTQYASRDRDSTSITEGFILAFVLFISAIVQTLLLHQYFHIAFTTGINVKSGLTAIIFKKSLVLSNASKQKLSTGEIFNRMSVDAQKISDIMSYINVVWSSPLQIILSILLLYNTIGYTSLAGVGIM